MTDNANTPPTDDVYFDRSEFLKAASAPEYATSERYRQDVAAKLQRSLDAGTVTPMGQRIAHEDTSVTWTAYSAPEQMYGSHNPLPGAHPVWAEAQKVATGFFRGPEEIAAAMGAPHFDRDPTYREAVREKIGRSIREGHINTDFAAADPAKR
jgi:hypothetical protein